MVKKCWTWRDGKGYMNLSQSLYQQSLKTKQNFYNCENLSFPQSLGEILLFPSQTHKLSRQKKKNIDYLNSKINQFGHLEIMPTVNREHAFSLKTHGMFTKFDHGFDHKNLHKTHSYNSCYHTVTYKSLSLVKMHY